MNDKPHRPFGVTLFALLVLIVAGVNFTRLILAVRNWDFLASLLPFSPLYLVITGLIWSAGGLVLTWGLWRGSAWAPRWTMVAMLIYSVYIWYDRLVMPGYQSRNQNWPFVLSVNLLLLLAGFLILTHLKSRLFFGDANDREPKNSRPD
jgi:hypothetical protein